MPKIKKIKAYEILASGGLPTVECEVILDNGISARASVPYGASVGSHESTVLVDEDPDRYGGMGVLKVCRSIEEVLGPKLVGMEPSVKEVDLVLLSLDPTEQKTKFGGNAILSISMAVARVGALQSGLELFQYLRQEFGLSGGITLPKPMVVVVEGGRHADNSTDFQEYLLTLVGDKPARENVRIASEIYFSARTILKSHGYSVNVGNEGAFAPEGIKSNVLPFEILVSAIEKAGFKPGEDAMLSLDAAASELYKNKVYKLSCENRVLDPSELLNLYDQIVDRFPVYSMEDILHEDSWSDWTLGFKKLGNKIKVIGDDLTVTNLERLKKSVELSAMNGILIKLNQAGSVTETINVSKEAKKAGFIKVPSHRGGGETNDAFMVDFAVAIGADFIKVGLTRGERVAKYNRLMEIERILENSA